RALHHPFFVYVRAQECRTVAFEFRNYVHGAQRCAMTPAAHHDTAAAGVERNHDAGFSRGSSCRGEEPMINLSVTERRSSDNDFLRPQAGYFPHALDGANASTHVARGPAAEPLRERGIITVSNRRIEVDHLNCRKSAELLHHFKRICIQSFITAAHQL